MAAEASNPPAAQENGFRCPRCGAFIQVTMQALLQTPGVTCGACGLELVLDPARSAAALAELRKLAAGTDEARRSINHGGAAQPGRD